MELALARVGMEDQIDKKVGVLSGGQLQRVLLALALEPLPQILLLDEPSTGVDAKGLKTFYSTVEEIKQKYDLTVLIITHDRGLMEEYADRLVLLNSTIVKVGTPQEVLLSEEYKQLLG